MTNKLLVLATLMAVMGASSLKAQLNVGSTSAPDASAILQLSSTTKGLRMPNVALTSTVVFGLTSPTSSAAAIGMSVYNTAAVTGTTTYPASGVGIYTWDGTGWVSANAAYFANNPTNIYTSNGTLSGTRTVTQAGNSLNFGGGFVTITPQGVNSGFQFDYGNALANPRIYSADTIELQSSGNPYQFNLLPSGNVGISTNAPTAKLTIAGTTNNVVDLYNYNSTGVGSQGATTRVYSARGTAAAPTALQLGDGLGTYRFGGYDGTSFPFAKSWITSYATENWSSTATGSNLVFSTSKNGGTATADAMTIDNNGNVGIGSVPDASAMLQVNSATGTKGLLLPYVTNTQRGAMTLPANGLLIFNTTTNDLQVNAGTAAAPVWQSVGVSTLDLALVGTRSHVTRDGGTGGNGTGTGTGGDNIAIGAIALNANTSGTQNMAIGTRALLNNKAGSNNISIGVQSLAANTDAGDNIGIGHLALSATTVNGNNIAIGSNAMANAVGTTNSGVNNVAIGAGSLTAVTGNATVNTGSSNVAVGNNALAANTTANGNVAVGGNAAQATTTGSSNTAVGQNAMGLNILGLQNSAFGFLSLYNNTGSYNTGLGVAAGSSNTSANYNTAVGYGAMSSANSITGGSNTSIGVQALQNISSGTNNAALGMQTLAANTTGANNLAGGFQAMIANISGASNVAMGHVALSTTTDGTANVALGEQSLLALLHGNYNTAVGNYSMPGLQTGTNNICVGNATNLPVNSVTQNDALNIGNSIFGIGLPNATSSYAYRPGVSTIGIFQANPNAAYSLDVLGTIHASNNLVIQSTGMPIMTISTTTAAQGAVPANASGNIYYESAGTENHVFGGNIAPDADNSRSLGLSSARWSAIWAGTTTISTSDSRLKTNIETSGYGLHEVMKMRPVTYNWKTNPAKDHTVGFIAQEMEKIIPEAVVAPKLANEYYGMRYDALIPVLTKAIQEQQAEIAAKDAKILALEARMEKLEKAVEAINK